MSHGSNMLTIGEFDPTGRTGLVLDRSTLVGFGHDPMMLVSCIKLGESETVSVASETLGKQLARFGNAHTVRNIKTGQLAKRDNIEVVASFLEDQELTDVNVTIDASLDADDRPVLGAGAVSIFRMRLLPLATVLIAHLSEAARLASLEVETISQMKEAAEAIHMYGPRVVVVRAHMPVDDEWIDIYYDGTEHQFLFRKTAPSADIRGMRDLFAAAVVAYMAQGRTRLDAVQLAQEYESRYSAAQQEKPA